MSGKAEYGESQYFLVTGLIHKKQNYQECLKHSPKLSINDDLTVLNLQLFNERVDPKEC